jgi:hypothetical protein
MLSDDRVPLALRALERPIAEFRLTIDGALAQAVAHLDALESDPAARTARLARELGPFGAGHIDASRMATLVAPVGARTITHVDRFRAAVDTLRDVLDRGEGLFVAQVPAGGSLMRAVDDALARVGRAFGAVLAIELLRGGTFDPGQHDHLLQGLPFRSWTRAERRYAPPLVVQVAGADLHVGGLSDYTDGRERIVLVVTGESPPAPLVRLITPGTMVMQTADAAGLEQMSAYEGPAIAALVPDGAAQFLHDPRAGREPWQRLAVWHAPAAPRHSICGISPWQMAEDLKQLAALAAAATPGGAGAAPVDSIDKLTSWLLGQGDLKGIA